MKLDEVAKSYIDDIKWLELIKFVTWRGQDVAAAWIGKYEPATKSDDGALVELATFNRDHYLYYLFFVENFMERDGKVMDVGCGSGQRTAMLGRYADTIVGIDSDPIKIAFARAFNFSGRVAYYCAEFPHITTSAPVDYMFVVEVIEHVELADQAEFINKAMTFLAPGGLLFLTTPADRVVERKSPHIGLWEFDDYAKWRDDPRTVRSGYLRAGSKDESDRANGSAYYLVLRRAD